MSSERGNLTVRAEKLIFGFVLHILIFSFLSFMGWLLLDNATSWNVDHPNRAVNTLFPLLIYRACQVMVALSVWKLIGVIRLKMRIPTKGVTDGGD